MLHLQFHHGVLAHLVSSGLWNVINADQLGLVPHAIALKSTQQVLVCLFQHWKTKRKFDFHNSMSENPHVMLLTLLPWLTSLFLLLERNLGGGRRGRRSGAGDSGHGAGVAVGRRAVLHLCRHGAGLYLAGRVNNRGG